MVLRREWIVRPNPAEIEKAKDGNRTTDLGVQEASVTLVVRAVSSLDGKWGGEARRKVMGVKEQRHRLLALVTLLPHHACLLLQGALDRSSGVLVSPELSAAPMTVGKVLPSLAMCFPLSIDLQGLIQVLRIIALEGVGADGGVQREATIKYKMEKGPDSF